MPDIASTRYELYDAPLFKAKVLGPLRWLREVLYQNAGGDCLRSNSSRPTPLWRRVPTSS
ncbi:substrate-binding domain-containing protein [Streptomyces californicus]